MFHLSVLEPYRATRGHVEHTSFDDVSKQARF